MHVLIMLSLFCTDKGGLSVTFSSNMPLSYPVDPETSPDGSHLSVTGEGINAEIPHQSRHYKKVEVGAVAAPVQAFYQEWLLDPILTCPNCKLVFRKGQLREYQHHIDKCQP